MIHDGHIIITVLISPASKTRQTFFKKMRKNKYTVPGTRVLYWTFGTATETKV
jgi:hypothetical protein